MNNNMNTATPLGDARDIALDLFIIFRVDPLK